MSSFKEKAEARRAKILARENARLAQAAGEGVAPVAGDDEAPVKTDRPLAKRRSIVIAAAKAAEQAAVDKALEDKKETTKTEDDAVNELFEESGREAPSVEVAAEMPCSDSVVAVDSDGVSLKEESKDTVVEKPEEVVAEKPKPRRKTIKEIEDEINKNTADFDAKVLREEKEKQEKDDKDSVKREDSAKEDEKVVAKSTNTVKKASPLNIGSVMRIFRCLLIIFISVGTGHRTAYKPAYAPALQNARSQYWVPTKIFVQSPASTDFGNMNTLDMDDMANTDLLDGDEFSEDVDTMHKRNRISGSAEYDDFQYSVSPDGIDQPSKTWVQWFNDGFTKRLDCSMTAVSLVWWASSFMKPILEKMVCPPSVHVEAGANGSSIINTILNFGMKFLNDGQSMLIDYLLDGAGEVALHATGAMITTTIATYYMQDAPLLSHEGDSSVGMGAFEPEL